MAQEIPALKKTVALKGNEYLESIDDWLETHVLTNGASAKGSPMRCGVGIYYFENAESDTVKLSMSKRR